MLTNYYIEISEKTTLLSQLITRNILFHTAHDQT